MNTMIKAEKQNGEETVRYEEDGQYTIPYQKRMLRLRMKEHTAGMEEKDGRLCYRIREGETLRTFWTGVKRPADVIRVLEALQRQEEATEEAMLDEDRWLWDPDYLVWDRETFRLRGVYLPDRRFTSDRISLIMEWASLLIRKSLQEEEEDEEMILFLHRFYKAAAGMQRKELSLREFLEKENAPAPAADPGPAVFLPAVIEESWMDQEEDPEEEEGWLHKLKVLLFPEKERSLRFE